MSKSTQNIIHRLGSQIDLLADAFAGWLAIGGVAIERNDTATRRTDIMPTVSPNLPPVFRALVTRYRYPAFEVGPLWFYTNIEVIAEDNWMDAAFADPYLTPPLLAQELVPFALPSTGSYDPVCFDTRRPLPDGDCPLVQVDHEEVLCYSRIGKVREIAPSFASFIENCLAREGTTP